ncbi:MAG: hypothetical protein ABI647_19520 [Gemmatimonadota bacterium]
MDAKDREKLAMAERARDFAHAHPLTVPGEVAVLTRLEELIDRFHTLAAQFHDGQLTVRAATIDRRALIAEVKGTPFTLLIETAHAAAKDLPQLKTLFRHFPGSISHEAFLTRAHSMVAQATANTELLTRYGMSETLLPEITGKLDGIELAAKRSNAGRSDHTGATADLVVVSSDIMATVAQLGAIYLHHFKDQPELRAAWKSARNLPWPIRSGTKAPPAAPADPERKPA